MGYLRGDGGRHWDELHLRLRKSARRRGWVSSCALLVKLLESIELAISHVLKWHEALNPLLPLAVVKRAANCVFTVKAFKVFPLIVLN